MRGSFSGSSSRPMQASATVAGVSLPLTALARSNKVADMAGLVSASGRPASAYDAGLASVRSAQQSQSTSQKPLGAASTVESSSHPMQRLERLEDELGHSAAYTGPHRWLIPYADLLTLLLGLFLAMLAMASRDNSFLTSVNQTLQQHLTQSQAVVSQQAQQLKAYEQLKATVSQVAKETHTTGAIVIHQTAEGVLIRLTDSLLFDSGSATLSSKAQQAVATLARGLRQQQEQRHVAIRVEGHTDNTPIATVQYPNNWALSTARATMLVSALVQHHHLNPAQLSAAGYAEFRPIASNSSAQGRQQNRRVDIIVLDPHAHASSAPAAPEIETPVELETVEATSL